MTSAVDRAPNGVTSRCDRCSRLFKGEPWMDYCAECHAENEKNDPLKRQYACLTCYAKFPLGDVRLIAGDGPHCPKCKSINIHPAHGEPITLETVGQAGALERN